MQHPTPLVKERGSFYLVNVLCSFLLLIPAIYNGYPLINSDLGTFLPSGFMPEMPVDRPIMYGLLLRLFSLNGLSLWLVIFIQAFIVSVLTTKLVQHFFRDNYLLRSATLILILSCFTGLSWTISQLQPDIFTPIAFLCMALLILARENRRNTVRLCLLYFVAIATHISHIMIFSILLCAIAVFFRKKVLQQRKRYLLLLCLTVLPVLTMTVPLAKSGHMFLMASMLEKGVLKQYLEDNCGAKQFRLCIYKDSLPPKGDDLLWEAYSPAMLEGGWKAVKPEYDQVNRDIMSTPKYLGMFAKRSFITTFYQLGRFDIGPGNVPLGNGPYIRTAFEKYVPSELDDINGARQQRGLLLPVLDTPNLIFNFVILFSSVAAIVIAFFFRRTLPRELVFFVFISVLCYLINAWDCATFSNINGRYACRLAWLIPFSLALQLFAILRRKTTIGQNS